MGYKIIRVIEIYSIKISYYQIKKFTYKSYYFRSQPKLQQNNTNFTTPKKIHKQQRYMCQNQGFQIPNNRKN